MSPSLNPVDATNHAFARSFADAGVQFFGAHWCPRCATQKELFAHATDQLPYDEVANPDQSPNASRRTSQNICQEILEA